MSYRFVRVKGNKMAGWPKKTERERNEAVDWMAKEFPRKSRWYRDAAIAWIVTRREQAPAVVMHELEEGRIVPSVPVIEQNKIALKEWKAEIARFGAKEAHRRRRQRKRVKTPAEEPLDALRYLLIELALVSHLEKSDPWGTEATIGTALANAAEEFDATVASGNLEVREDGTVSTKKVKAIWGADSGQGIGRQRHSHHDPALVAKLVNRFRSGPCGATIREDLKEELYGDGGPEAKTMGNSKFQGLLKLAFKLTKKEIKDDERLYDLTQSAQGISPEVAATQRAYLDSWFPHQRGRNRHQ